MESATVGGHGRLVPADADPQANVCSPNASERDLVLYAADTPNSWKVAQLLEELQQPYDVVWVDIMRDEQKAPPYIAMNPNGRTPTLVDRSVSPPFAVFESGAILLYLAEKFDSPLLPKAATLRSEAIQWIVWQVSALGPMIGQCMYFKRIASPVHPDVAKLQFSIDRFERESYRLLGVLELRLAGRHYLVGPAGGAYTLADLACYGYAASWWWAGLSLADFPAVAAWLARCEARPATAAGVRVPGISVLGAGGPTFEDIRSDARGIQRALERSAREAGRPYFGWKDLTALLAAEAGTDSGANPFESSVASAPRKPLKSCLKQPRGEERAAAAAPNAAPSASRRVAMGVGVAAAAGLVALVAKRRGYM